MNEEKVKAIKSSVKKVVEKVKVHRRKNRFEENTLEEDEAIGNYMLDFFNENFRYTSSCGQEKPNEDTEYPYLLDDDTNTASKRELIKVNNNFVLALLRYLSSSTKIILYGFCLLFNFLYLVVCGMHGPKQIKLEMERFYSGALPQVETWIDHKIESIQRQILAVWMDNIINSVFTIYGSGSQSNLENRTKKIFKEKHNRNMNDILSGAIVPLSFLLILLLSILQSMAVLVVSNYSIYYSCIFVYFLFPSELSYLRQKCSNMPKLFQNVYLMICHVFEYVTLQTEYQGREWNGLNAELQWMSVSESLVPHEIMSKNTTNSILNRFLQAFSSFEEETQSENSHYHKKCMNFAWVLLRGTIHNEEQEEDDEDAVEIEDVKSKKFGKRTTEDNSRVRTYSHDTKTSKRIQSSANSSPLMQHETIPKEGSVSLGSMRVKSHESNQEIELTSDVNEISPMMKRNRTYNARTNSNHSTPRRMSSISYSNTLQLNPPKLDIPSLKNASPDRSNSTTSRDSMDYQEDLNLSVDTEDPSIHSKNVADWVDVGTRIGFRLLNNKSKTPASENTQVTEDQESKHNETLVQKDLSMIVESKSSKCEETETVKEEKDNMRASLSAPVHSMWTGLNLMNQEFTDLSFSSTSSAPLIDDLKDIENELLMSDDDDGSINKGLASRQVKSKRALQNSTNTLSTPTSQLLSSKSLNKSTPSVTPSSYSLELLRSTTPRIAIDKENVIEVDTRNSITRSRHSSSSARSSSFLKRLKSSPSFRSASKPIKKCPILLSGCKMLVPMNTHNMASRQTYLKMRQNPCAFQIATVVSCVRLSGIMSIQLQLDKSYLRDGKFASMYMRIPDDIRYMPRHSCFPIGSCVGTSLGVGVLVGWRMEDDVHIIRSLWKHRGPGSALAYLRRDSIHGVLEAAVGCHVRTIYGEGNVLGYVYGGRTQCHGKYFVQITQTGRRYMNVMKFDRRDILECPSSTFIPVIEQIRAAAQYQIQMDSYQEAIMSPEDDLGPLQWSHEIEILFHSLIKAVGEDPNFDAEVNNITTSLISFLEGLDIGNSADTTQIIQSPISKNKELPPPELSSVPTPEQGLWFMNDLFGGMLKPSDEPVPDEPQEMSSKERDNYERTYAGIHTLNRALTIARAEIGSSKPNSTMALSIGIEILDFLKTVLKVRQSNVSEKTSIIRERVFEQVKQTLVPLQERLTKVGKGITKRLEHHGMKAKTRLARLFTTLIKDERLLYGLEDGDWDLCLERIERAIMKSRLLDKKAFKVYKDSILAVYQNLAPRQRNQEAVQRSGNTVIWFAKLMNWAARPKQSILKLIMKDEVLEVFERILTRVFSNNKEITQMINIHAFNFRSFRSLRMLLNMEISGKLWIPLLDAADEEFSWAVGAMPPNTKEFIEPIAKLFSLGVANFRELKPSEIAGDWLNFLTVEPAVTLIHELDMKLVLCTEGFCKDVKETVNILPYYKSIDADILSLLDEFDLGDFLHLLQQAKDVEKLSKFLRDKSLEALDRFLRYLPKMSIPIEKRDISDGWVLTCRGKNGGDLKLSDVRIEKENLTCCGK